MATQKKDRKVGYLEIFLRKKHRTNQPTSWKYVFVFLGVTIHGANDLCLSGLPTGLVKMAWYTVPLSDLFDLVYPFG